MLRRLIVLTALAAGMSITAAMALDTAALAKGPSQAQITGPGLARAIVLSGGGEPGQQGTLATLAGQTSLFTLLFGPGSVGPAPTLLPTAPPSASLGPRYTIIYTVPGVTPQPGQQFGRIRQYLYPRAAGGPVIYTPPGQAGFGQELQDTGWLRGSPQLARTLASLGVPRPSVRAARRASRPPATRRATHRSGSRAAAWPIAAGAVIVAAALAGTMLLPRRRQAVAPDSEPAASGTGAR